MYVDGYFCFYLKLGWFQSFLRSDSSLYKYNLQTTRNPSEKKKAYFDKKYQKSREPSSNSYLKPAGVNYR